MNDIAMYVGYACIGFAGLLVGFTLLAWFFVLIWRYTGVAKMLDGTKNVASAASFYAVARDLENYDPPLYTHPPKDGD